MSRPDALALVTAKLKRRPQDQLQAAVVLEAWAGVKAPDSFALTSDHFEGAEEPMPGATERQAPGTRLVDFAVLFTVVATAVVWVPALRTELGDAVTISVQWGLPIALALDSTIRIRYLSSSNVRSLRSTLLAANALLATALIAALWWGPVAATAVSVVIVWGLATVVSTRGWYLAYIAVAVTTSLTMWFTTADQSALAGAAFAILAITTAAVLTEDGVSYVPETWRATVAAMLIGGANGLMLVADPGVWQTATVTTTGAILLVTITGWIASVRLTRIWVDLPRQLADTPIEAERPGFGLGPIGRAVLSATVRVVLPTVSALAFYAAIDADRGRLVVLAFCCFALATLSMSLNIATRHWIAAAVIASIGATVTVLMPNDVAGLALLAGSAVILVTSGTLAFSSFRDSTAAFTTRMLVR